MALLDASPLPWTAGMVAGQLELSKVNAANKLQVMAGVGRVWRAASGVFTATSRRWTT